MSCDVTTGEALPLPGGGGGVAGEVSVSLTVQPLLETGVVLVLTTPTLTTPTTAQPLLAVGLVQGEVRECVRECVCECVCVW